MEIRYEPTSGFLDRRGNSADLISRDLGLQHWEIGDNRVDVFSQESNERAFVSFRNCGYSCVDAEPAARFPDRAGKFLRFLGSHEILPEPLAVQRIGVRSKFLKPFEGTFHDLLDRYLKRCGGPAPGFEAISDAQLEDVGMTLELADDLGKFRTQSGPMNLEAQMRFFMGNRDVRYPEVGLYFDVDYHSERHQSLRMAELALKVKILAEAGVRRFERIDSLILAR